MLRATRLVTASKCGFTTIVDASPSFKVAAVDNGQPTSSVTVLLKAGSRYESKPGVAHTLSNFAFKSTGKRSALGTVHEAELYGGVLSSSLSCEHLALTAEFLHGDEAYFVNVLTLFLASPKFTRHELSEYVLPAVHSESNAAIQSALTHAVELAHALAFRTGLSHSLYADAHATGNVTAEDVRDLHTRAVSNPSSIAVLGRGISTDTLAKLFESAYSSHAHKKTSPSTPEAHASPAVMAYHGGTTRIASSHGLQTLFIGFSSMTASSVPALHTLCAHLNCTPSLKWSAHSASPLASLIPAGVSAYSVLLPYTDASLLGIVLQGSDPHALKEAASAVVTAFKDAAGGKVGKEELVRATARAKFQIAAGVEGREGYVGAFGPMVLKGEQASVQKALEGVEGVNGTSLSQVVAGLVKRKLMYVAEGDLRMLPYVDEIGLSA